MTHHCMALNYSDEMSFLWTDSTTSPARCEAPASILVRIGGDPVWLCADCYDLYCQWIGHEPCEF